MGGLATRITAADFVTAPELHGYALAAHGAGGSTFKLELHLSTGRRVKVIDQSGVQVDSQSEGNQTITLDVQEPAS